MFKKARIIEEEDDEHPDIFEENKNNKSGNKI